MQEAWLHCCDAPSQNVESTLFWTLPVALVLRSNAGTGVHLYMGIKSEWFIQEKPLIMKTRSGREQGDPDKAGRPTKKQAEEGDDHLKTNPFHSLCLHLLR